MKQLEREDALYTANAPAIAPLMGEIADIVDGRRGSMPNGTIKRLVRDRGFGFIRDDGGQEWFFHRSSVQGSF